MDDRQHLFSLLVYSKFSKNSMEILNVIKNSETDFEKYTGLQFFCIDNKQVRENILKHSKLKIEMVPCLFIGYSNGLVEKYENQTLLMWVQEMIHKNSVVNTSSTISSTNVEMKIPLRKKEKKIPSVKITKQTISSSIGSTTPISSLLDQDEEQEDDQKDEEQEDDQEEDEKIIHKKMLNLNKLKYEKIMDNKENEKSKEELKINNLSVSNNIKNTSTKSVIELAREMEKNRE